MREVVIAGYLRTANSRSKPKDPGQDCFQDVRADDLLAQLLPETLRRCGVAPPHCTPRRPAAPGTQLPRPRAVPHLPRGARCPGRGPLPAASPLCCRALRSSIRSCMRCLDAGERTPITTSARGRLAAGWRWRWLSSAGGDVAAASGGGDGARRDAWRELRLTPSSPSSIATGPCREIGSALVSVP